MKQTTPRDKYPPPNNKLTNSLEARKCIHSCLKQTMQ